ncbi:MAG: ferrous iron transport protein B, partial [Cyclobacteriaceae bacterium]|nr:ferrous iron transport protein B [Cyclobacteriaceae bacterium]
VLNSHNNSEKPDMVIAIADAVNLKRNLLLFTQLYDLGIPVILALNMMDVAKRSGIDIDIEKIQEKLKVPVIPINARTGLGITEIKKILIEPLVQQNGTPFMDVRHLAPDLIKTIRQSFKLENDYQAYQIIQQYKYNYQLSKDEKDFIGKEIEKSSFDIRSPQAQETIERYAVINELINGAIRINQEGKQYILTDKIDKILTHKIWGFFFFFIILGFIFQSVFAWAQYPMELIDSSISNLSFYLQSVLPEGALFDLLTEGIIPGIGGILMFIPQIALLFAFVAFLEETGYMARVVFLMDKIMRQFGLNGRSIVPLISGVACAIPAILATRAIDNWKDRLITIFVIPLVSCSARLPVYTILIALVVPDTFVFGIFNLQGLSLMALYLLGFIAAILSALFIRQFVVRKGRSFLIMELPLYKLPRLKNVGMNMWERSMTFTVEAGKVILAISIILWVLASYGPGDRLKKADEVIAARVNENRISQEEFDNQVASYKLENSYAGIFGKTIEPMIKPLGFDWKIGIALITSFAAREVFVGTMATIYSIGTDNQDASSLKKRLQEEINPYTGKPFFNTAVAVSLILFYAFAMQCMSTLAVVMRETKSIKWPILQLVYMSGLAYISSFIAYTLLK